MAKKKSGQSFFERFRYKYRLSIYRDETYEEVLNLKLSRLNVFTLIGLATLVFLTIVISIIAYTPAREFIPGYPSAETVIKIRRNAILLDSLELEIVKRDQYFENMRKIIMGEEPDYFDHDTEITSRVGQVEFSRSAEDSILRQMIEQEGQFSLNIYAKHEPVTSVLLTHFFPPVKGLVTSTFNAISNHYGVDIVAGPNEVVKAALDGTVIVSSWTIETGNVILLQHENNLLSVYKHNAELLKRQGEYVKAGEPIAIVGNSGELTTGPHLHFELWYNKTPLNPLDYISF